MSTTIETDLRCTTCGYHLRALKDDSACPECGTAISKSLPTDDKSWLIAIRQGISLHLFAFGAALVFIVSLPLIRWLVNSYFPSAYNFPSYYYYIFGGAVMLLFLWSVWKIGTPRSATLGPIASRRSALRIAAVIYLVTYFIQSARDLVFTSAPPPFFYAVFFTVESLVYLARGWLLWTCVRYILVSIEQIPMAVHANIIRWIVGVLNLSALLRNYTFWTEAYYLSSGVTQLDYYYPLWMYWMDSIQQWGVFGMTVWAFIFFIRTRNRVAGVEPGTFGADIAFFARIVRGKMISAWHYFVSRLRYHGPPPEEEDPKNN